MPRFKNPPIIEAWILFSFGAPPNKTAWGFEQAERFAALIRKEFSLGELFFRQEVDVEELDESKPPRISRNERILEKIRMTNEARTRCVQIADEKLVFNVLTGGSNYPGFQSLVNEALHFVKLYEQTYDCGAPHSVILHYKDIVRISVPTSLTIDLEDYFTIIRDLPPEPFGNTRAFASYFQTVCPTDELPLTINVNHLPPADGEFRFQLDWEKVCKPGDFSDRDLLRSSLSETSEFMVECFEKSITPKTRELFEPTS